MQLKKEVLANLTVQLISLKDFLNKVDFVHLK
jgi:hypothetical protein